MNILASWIKRHQIIAFFMITFLITGGLGFSYDQVINHGKIFLAPLVFTATCGPALAGIIVTTVSNTLPRQGTRKPFWVGFFIAWILSTMVFLANNIFINHAPFSIGLAIFALISVTPVAFVISMAFSRISAVKQYVSSLVRLRGVYGWALLALVLIPLTILLSILITCLLHIQNFIVHRFMQTGLVLIGLIVVKFFYQLFFFNATGEEVGWRGFALPRLQSITSPLIACLLINLFWPLWHFFLWMAEGKPVFSPVYWEQTYLQLFSATVIISWLYNRSKGSILVAGIAHAAANTTFYFFPNLYIPIFNWTCAAAALVLIVVGRMWKKLPPDHPAVYRSS